MAINKEASVLEGTFPGAHAEKQITDMFPRAVLCWTATRDNMIFRVGPKNQMYFDTEEQVKTAIAHTLESTPPQHKSDVQFTPRNLEVGETYDRHGDTSWAARTHGKDDGRHGSPNLTGYNRPLYKGE